jgi:putative ABC transport system permease protein
MHAEVVGVVEHTRLLDLRRPVRGQIYRPLGGAPVVAVVVRTRTAPEVVASDVRAIVRSLNPKLAVDDLQPMTTYVADALASSWFSLVLMNVFGLAALVLATVGIYGVIAYSIGQRTREFGIRLALGEEPSRIRNLILRDGLTLFAISLPIGVAGAMVVGRLLQDLLYGIAPTDAPTYVGAAAVLAAAALFGCYVPALRVMRLNANAALRTE